jgi:hypothetical protein
MWLDRYGIPVDVWCIFAARYCLSTCVALNADGR